MSSRLFKYAVKNILRNKFLSFSSIIVLSVLMFIVNILMIIHNLSNYLIEQVNSKLTISLFLKDEYDKNHPDLKKLVNDIKSKLPNVEVLYKSKEDALEEMRKLDEELVSIVWAQNPLPQSIHIKNIKIEQYENLNYIIESKLYLLQERKKNDKYDYRMQYNRITKILFILKTLKLVLYIIIFIFLLSIFVITYSIIWNFIYHYKNEIYITKLVWWDNMFIYWPFLYQWIIYSLLWFLLSALVFLVIANNLSFLFQEKIISLIIKSDLKIILFAQLIIFTFIWRFSAFLSTKKYINNS